MRRFLLLTLLVMALPSVAHAQWTAVPHGGYLIFDEESAVASMPIAGIELVREVNDLIGIGVTVDYAQGNVDGSKFPPAELSFGPDSTIFATIDQSVSVFHYGVWAEFRPSLNTFFQPYVGLGGGGYTFYMSAQQWDQPKTITGARLAAGGGLRFQFGDNSGLVLDIRDIIYPSFDPNRLNTVSEENRADRFPELNPAPLTEGAMHNFRLTIGLEFRSGGGG